MGTTTIISIIISSLCFMYVIIWAVNDFLKVIRSDKITLVRGDKKITISRSPTKEDKRKLLKF